MSIKWENIGIYRRNMAKMFNVGEILDKNLKAGICRVQNKKAWEREKKIQSKKTHIPKNVCSSEFKDVVSCAPSGAIASVAIKNNES
jgi:hypothetical protein